MNDYMSCCLFRDVGLKISIYIFFLNKPSFTIQSMKSKQLVSVYFHGIVRHMNYLKYMKRHITHPFNINIVKLVKTM
jgi:hypothetical protein